MTITFAAIDALDLQGRRILNVLKSGTTATRDALTEVALGDIWYNSDPNTPNTCLLYTSPSPRD